MRFLIDQDVPSDIGRVLSQAGHDAALVRDTPGAVADDQQVLDQAVAQDLILISCNRDDFVRLCARQSHPGLIISLRRRTRIEECAAVVKLLQSAGESGIAGSINFT